MLSASIQWGLTSLVLIILLHYLYTHLQKTLTTPQIKDLVYQPNKKYQEILEAVQNQSHVPPPPLLPPTNNMKTELKDFLNDLGKKNPEPAGVNNFASY